MDDVSVLTRLFLSLILGAAVGLERESYEDSLTEDKQGIPGALGVRTFSLITLLGSVTGILHAYYFHLFLLVTATFMVLVVAYYVTGSFLTKDNGMTTELAVLFSYLLGMFIGLEFFSIQIIIALAVILILIMSRKHNIKHFVTTIKRHELNGFISYAIIALVVLPFLPNQAYSLSDAPALVDILNSYGFTVQSILHVEVFNPYKIWLVVAIVTGVDVLGYVLKKAIGHRKGWGIASMVGGFVSSTATTVSLAQQSKKSETSDMFVAAAVLSNIASFVQIFILVAVFSSELLVASTSFIISIFGSGMVISLFFMYRSKKQNENLEADTSGDGSIFSVVPAVTFAVIFVVVQIGSKLAHTIFGANGLFVTSAIAALAGVGAAVITISELVGSVVTIRTALWALVIVNTVNLLAKVGYSYVQGSRSFANKFAVSMVLIIVASLVGILSV